MNRPIDLFELFVWAVRIALVAILLALVFGCALNTVSMSTNPVCVIGCTATPSPASASGVRIDQTITREGGTLDVNSYP